MKSPSNFPLQNHRPDIPFGFIIKSYTLVSRQWNNHYYKNRCQEMK